MAKTGSFLVSSTSIKCVCYLRLVLLLDRNDRCLYPFIHLKPEKGTPFGWSLSVKAIIGSTSPPPPRTVLDTVILYELYQV